MTEILVGSSLPHVETQKRNSHIAIIGFAGAYSGGSNNAQYKELLTSHFGSENALIVPSVSTKFAYDNEPKLSIRTYKNNEYYRDLASLAIEKFPNQDTFIIHCHSGGGIEGLAFARALLENDALRTKKIRFLFSGGPGFTETQTSSVGRALELLNKFINTSINRADYQHFDLCPPPEEYFTYAQKNQPQTNSKLPQHIDVVYKDTPDTRETRRKAFYNKYMNFLSSQEKGAVTVQLKHLDDSIKQTVANSGAHTEKDLKKLLHRRAKLVFSIGGDRYYNDYVANKPEFKNVPSHGMDGSLIGALYLMRQLTSVGKGMETKLAEVIQIAKLKQIRMDFSFGLLENDKFISLSDMSVVTTRLSKANILDSLSGWLVIEGLSHESIDNSPQGIFGAIMKLSELSV